MMAFDRVCLNLTKNRNPHKINHPLAINLMWPWDVCTELTLKKYDKMRIMKGSNYLLDYWSYLLRDVTRKLTLGSCSTGNHSCIHVSSECAPLLGCPRKLVNG